MTEQSIRFSVRNEKSQRGQTWKLFTQVGSGKNDIYLLCRALGNSFKASMHESGSWHVGFTRKFTEEQFETGHPKREDPYIERWPCPVEFAPGYILAYRIVTPTISVNIPLDGKEKKSISWITAAPESRAIEVAVIIAAKGTIASGWPGKRSMGTRFVGRLKLDNGETLWVVAMETSAPDLALPQGRMAWFDGKSKRDIPKDGARALVFGGNEDGSRFMVDCLVSSSG